MCRTDAHKINVSQDAERGLGGVELLTQHQPPRPPSPDESAAQALRKALGRTPSAEVRRRAEGLLKSGRVATGGVACALIAWEEG